MCHYQIPCLMESPWIARINCPEIQAGRAENFWHKVCSGFCLEKPPSPSRTMGLPLELWPGRPGRPGPARPHVAWLVRAVAVFTNGESKRGHEASKLRIFAKKRMLTFPNIHWTLTRPNFPLHKDLCWDLERPKLP